MFTAFANLINKNTYDQHDEVEQVDQVGPKKHTATFAMFATIAKLNHCEKITAFFQQNHIME